MAHNPLHLSSQHEEVKEAFTGLGQPLPTTNYQLPMPSTAITES